MADNPDPNPMDFMTNMGEMASGMHEFYLEMCKAGFTDEQAMDLVKEMIRDSMGSLLK